MNKVVFDIKGSMMAVSVINLYVVDLVVFEEYLNKTIADSPDLFINMPVLIDLSTLPNDELLNFKLLKAIICKMPFIAIGLRNVPQGMIEAANREGWRIVTSTKKSSLNTQLKAEVTNNNQVISNEDLTSLPDCPDKKIEGNEQNKKFHTLKVNQPVRSGQQIYAKSDIVLLKMVSTGAEILADGDIHLYGPMRGRALAGVNGDKTAQIFCHSLNAELVSIAGYFKLFDQISDELKGKSVRVYLENDQLQIELLV